MEEAWAAGGGGILLRTTNGGKSWTRDKAADNIAANLYSVKYSTKCLQFCIAEDLQYFVGGDKEFANVMMHFFAISIRFLQMFSSENQFKKIENHGFFFRVVMTNAYILMWLNV
ncbi:hypothetical protein DITRI_Ditri01bG0105800 [Diplodiscus trichospermus]